MFKKILVCLDGSTSALDAMRTVSLIAEQFGSEILALNVFQTPYADPSDFGVWAIAIDQAAVERCAREQLKSLERAIAPLFEHSAILWRVIQEQGHPVDTILRVVDREKADLIIVGSRGLRGVKELLLGSTSSGVLHHATCPVLIVRGDNTPCGTIKFCNILLVSDGSPCAQRASRIAIGLAEKAASSLTVLNVYEDLDSVNGPCSESVVPGNTDTEVHAKQWLAYVAQPVSELAKEAGVNCLFVQEGGHPVETIVAFAGKHHVDLIVMGSRGLSGYSRMVIGSVSNRVVHHANCPVLVVR